jgi:hypothetical protein
MGADRALQPRGGFRFFVVDWVEGLAVLLHAADDVEEFGHNRSHNDDGRVSAVLLRFSIANPITAYNKNRSSQKPPKARIFPMTYGKWHIPASPRPDGIRESTRYRFPMVIGGFRCAASLTPSP